MASSARKLFERRKNRVRLAVKRNARSPRLSVFRSSQHIYAQIIDDTKGVTLASASTVEKDLRDSLAKTHDVAAAEKVGELIAKRAKAAKVSKIVFDRGPYLYHGRVKALAEAARKNGLEF